MDSIPNPYATISAVVEGHGEVDSVPIVVRRIGLALPIPVAVGTPRPVRVPRSKLVQDEQLERAVRLASLRVAEPGGVLIVIDADHDCPAELGPELLSRATAALPGTRVGVVIAKSEFEAWFLAAAESLAGTRELPEDLSAPDNPEGIRGAKGWLRQRMPTGRKYSETVDQPSLASRFDLAAARAADSFDKMWREVAALVVGATAADHAD